MIYNTKNQSDETAESQEENKTCFNAHVQYSQSKFTGLNNMWLLKILCVRVELVHRQYIISPARFCSDVLFLLF